MSETPEKSAFDEPEPVPATGNSAPAPQAVPLEQHIEHIHTQSPSYAPGITRLPPRKANAMPVSKEQLDRFRARELSAEDRVRFDQYLLNGEEDDLNEPTREYKKFLKWMSNGQAGEPGSETAKPPRKLPVASIKRPLTPEKQLIAKETPGWTLVNRRWLKSK